MIGYRADHRWRSGCTSPLRYQRSSLWPSPITRLCRRLCTPFEAKGAEHGSVAYRLCSLGGSPVTIGSRLFLFQSRVLSRVDRGLQWRFIEEEVALLSEKQKRMPRIPKGLVIVYTGRGKGKTTAALGLVLRALGQGLRVCVVQFIKSDKGRWGETLMAEKLGLEWHAMGEGYTWRSEHVEDDAARAREAWVFAQDKIARAEYDLVVLDEFTYTLAYSWLDTDQAISWLAAFRPRETHVVITGRDAPPALIDFADLVTDMRAVKHPFDAGVPAQRGIEF